MRKFDPISIEKIKEIFFNWINSLTQEEKEALRYYSSEDGYTYINDLAKNGDLNNFYVKNIQTSLEKFILDTELAVYRAEYRDGPSYEKTIDLYSCGLIEELIIPYYNFISTSFSESCAWNFLQDNLIKKNKGSIYFFMKAIVSKGIKCGYIYPDIAYFGESEREILLTKDLVFKFEKIIGKEDENIIEIEGSYHDFDSHIGNIILNRGRRLDQ